jgi:DNA-binding response OmpR family regulator
MKILVAEDEICQQEWLTRNLSNTGQEVTTACDGDRFHPSQVRFCHAYL